MLRPSTKEVAEMADTAIFIGWGNPVRGREAKAIQVLNESMAYWAGLQASGDIESFEVYLLGPHGGDLNGFALLKGDRAKLMQVQQAEEFERTVARAQLIVENLGIVPANGGQALAAQMATYSAQLAELA
jgi:hypothetical protein